MNKLPVKFLRDYASLLGQVKDRIRQAQTRAVLSANAEMIQLYWEVGRLLVQQQATQGWGAGVLRRLASDLHNELPEVKGFSERNLKLMTQFHREYPQLSEIGQQPVAQLQAGKVSEPIEPAASGDVRLGQQLVAQLPWGHNVVLMQKVKSPDIRLWYMQQTLQNGWSRSVLHLMIESKYHVRRGKAVTNFPDRLPPAQSDLATQALKDPYIFDFLTLERPFHERELETELLKHLQNFLIELGQGFAFVGRQYHVAVPERRSVHQLLAENRGSSHWNNVTSRNSYSRSLLGQSLTGDLANAKRLFDQTHDGITVSRGS
jgi:predicted nuclease of restriction endonuclease-like (RecB) superfamily